MAALTFAPVIIGGVKVNFETVLSAAQQVAFPKRNSAAALPPQAALPSPHQERLLCSRLTTLFLGEVRMKFCMLSFLQDKVK